MINWTNKSFTTKKPVSYIHAIFKRNFLAAGLGFALSYPLSLSAVELNLSDVPLSTVTSAPPNVMLLLDNSGSMRSITWYQGNGSTIPAYDDTATYENWCENCGANNRWAVTQALTPLSSLNRFASPQGSCNPANFDLTDINIANPYNPGNPYVVPRYLVEGKLGTGATSPTKCLVLPDISGNGSTTYSGRYLNYLFQYFNDGDDLSTIIPFKTRITVMQEVSTSLVETTTGMRFGLSTFDGNDGARVVVGNRPPPGAGVLNNNNRVITGINALIPSGTTPLAESMYEITRYFRNMRPAYGNVDDFDDPIEYSCQKNFVIAVTDGLPNNDTTFNAGDDGADIATYCPNSTGGCAIPDWDGFGNTGVNIGTTNYFNDSGSWYFDDIVKFAYDLDMKRGPGWDDPPFAKQNVETYVVGFSIHNQLLEEAGHYGSGRNASDAFANPPTNYFTANDEYQLREDLAQALTSIEGRSGSAASVAASTGFIGAGASIFQGVYDTSTWTGNVRWMPLNVLLDNDPTNDVWSTLDAATQLTDMITSGVNRNIITLNSETNTGVTFEWNNISAAQQTQLDNRQEILSYLRGNQDCEANNASTACTSPMIKNLRDRNSSGEGFLGTIVNSTPIFVEKPSAYYPRIWPRGNDGTDAPENSASENYETFKKTHYGRQGVVYVGANDGMLHAFDGGRVGNPFDQAADSPVDPTLREIFAYVPSEVYDNLPDFASSTYQHKYYVDGTPNIMDVFYNGAWHSVLVGGLNGGGQGIYALDVTEPARFGTNNVLWEFTDEDDRDLGFTYSRPAIVRMHNGVWAAVFGNGYNNTYIDEGDANGDGLIDSNDDTNSNDSTTGTAVLYIVDIATGALIQKIDTGIGAIPGDPSNTTNGLSTVSPVDIDGDFIADFIYAGDLYGNLWRFDVTSNNPTSWGILGKGNPTNPTVEPIFSARRTGQNQPITTRPEVTFTSGGSLMIYFGTGQYLQVPDIANTDVQSFYGLLDNPLYDKHNNSTVTRRADMRPSFITNQQVTMTATGGMIGYRQVSNDAPDIYSSWYMDLIPPTGSARTGERVVGPAIVRGRANKTVIFTSIVPTEGVCDFGGVSWLMELDARNGNQTRHAVFDINNDGLANSADNTGDIVTNGLSQTGIQTTPNILRDATREAKLTTGSTGALSIVSERKDIRNGQRQSWRQIK